MAWKSQIEDDPECGEPIFDRKCKNGALRVAVATKDTVHLANIHDTTKEFVEKGKEEKNLTEMQVAAKKKEVLKHCDIEDDAQQMAANMVRKSGLGLAGSAFQGLLKSFVVSFCQCHMKSFLRHLAFFMLFLHPS